MTYSDPQGASATDDDGMAGTVAALFVPGPPDPWIPTVASLRTQAPGLRIAVSGPGAQALADRFEGQIENVGRTTSADMVDYLYRRDMTHILLIIAPAVFPPLFLDRALDVADSDLRCSSVSFLSNVGGFAGFPVADQVSIHQVEDLDETAITRRLRAQAEGLSAVPLPYPVGPAVLVTSQGLSTTASFPDLGDRTIVALASFSARARARGMMDMLDPATFVARPTDVPDDVPEHAGLAPGEEAFLAAEHPGLMRLPRDPAEPDAAFRQALDLARAVTFGVRIALDGSCLGHKEMGTQVTFLAMVSALAARDDVAYVGIALPGPLPRYADRWLTSSKIDARVSPIGSFSGFPHVDIVHRPFQVTPGIDVASWRSVGKRLVITVHDLVAFHVPDYHRDPEEWFAHREVTRSSTAAVDGIVAISEDTRRQIRLERLSVDDQRVFTVPNGVGHLAGDEPESEPRELFARGFNGERFILVLGTNYTHKNRDLAIRVARDLRERGHSLALVMAGPLVPFGSSRVAEALASAPGEPVFTVPDVSSEERNWLLRHADLVLYPSGAEGFGLIPHEAAAFGTPTVVVPFGPFEDRLADLPVAPKDWGVTTLADACAELLADPALARDQVRAVVAATPLFDWDASAGALVEVYRSLLACPPVTSRSAPQ